MLNTFDIYIYLYTYIHLNLDIDKYISMILNIFKTNIRNNVLNMLYFWSQTDTVFM